MTLTVGSLFSGIGGLDLGLERAGMKILWQVEQDPYAHQVLKKHWPRVPLYPDVRDIGRGLAPVDLICGGFPCQPFSTASRGRPAAEDLWPEMLRVVCDLRPRHVLAENVTDTAIERAASDLTDKGYTCGVVFLPASVVGAPHERPRWFVVADSNGHGESLCAKHEEVASIPSLAGFEAWSSVPERLGMDDGLPSRLDRLRCLGNAVVPQVAEYLGLLILNRAYAERSP